MLPKMRGDALTMVPDTQPNRLSALAGENVDGGPCRRKLDGVGQQVGDGLVQALTIHMNCHGWQFSHLKMNVSLLGKGCDVFNTLVNKILQNMVFATEGHFAGHKLFHIE